MTVAILCRPHIMKYVGESESFSRGRRLAAFLWKFWAPKCDMKLHYHSYPLVIEHSHGIDGPFIDGLAIKNADIFHGYVK